MSPVLSIVVYYYYAVVVGIAAIVAEQQALRFCVIRRRARYTEKLTKTVHFFQQLSTQFPHIGSKKRKKYLMGAQYNMR